MRAPASSLCLAAALSLWPERALATDPIVTSLSLFAGSRSGLWRSSDWGQTWERLSRAPAGGAPGALRTIHAIWAQGRRVYAGGEGGVFISEDFGGSWKGPTLEATVLSLLASRYPHADPTVFAGTTMGLLKSEDAGLTFRPTAVTGTPVFRMDWPGPALIVATGRGVLISSDAGKTFSGPGSGFPEGNATALASSSYFIVDPVLFAGVGAAGVFRSSDGGKTWRSAGLSGHAVRDLVWLGPVLYAATEKGLFRSGDLGERWAPVIRGESGRSPTRLLFPLAPDSSSEIFLGTDQGVSRSSDGGTTWSHFSVGGEAVLSLGTFPPPERRP